MQGLATAWLMAALTHSPLLIALVQTAAGLPIFLVALPAGVLADSFDRRRLLLVTQVWAVLVTASLTLLTFEHALSPALLLALIFLLGIGNGLTSPTWQAYIVQL